MELSVEILKLYVVTAAVPRESFQGFSCFSLDGREFVAGFDARCGLTDGFLNFRERQFTAEQREVGAIGAASAHHHVTLGASARTKEIALASAGISRGITF